MRLLSILSIALLLSSCDTSPPDNIFQGYVEGHQLNLAPRSTGILRTLYVTEGEKVAAGAILFTLDSERAEAQLDQALAARSASEALLANLRKGGRVEEIHAATQSLRQAEASLTLAEKTYQRSKELVDSGVVAIARLDQDKAALETLRASVTQAQSRLDIVRLPARDNLITSAEHDVEVRNATILLAKAELNDRSVTAPAAGRIETIFRRTGETTGPTQPVLALVPPEQKRIRFFVPEGLLARVHFGASVTLGCDNCPNDLMGKITFISNQAEFTPPIIFTEKERAKLVYLIEAQPEKPESFLNGQPVSVTLQ
jgi:HlyD family secretion protein